MATYLSICQDVALECGTVMSPSGKPTSVTSQTGTLSRIVQFVNTSYEDVQLHSNRWRWMESRFSSALTATVAAYSASDLGITSRFGNWLNPGEFPSDEERQFTLYETSEGQSDQGYMQYMEWPVFYARTQVGANAAQTGKPEVISIDNDEKLHVWPTPDATGYTLGGPYRKGLHVLSADGDEPEFNEQFHNVLKYGALVKLGLFDEAPPAQINPHFNKYEQYMQDLRSRYLPAWRASEPLV